MFLFLILFKIFLIFLSSAQITDFPVGGVLLINFTKDNCFILNSVKTEFVLDFTRILPGVPKAKVHSRIIIAPPHAKTFLKALNENVSKFESKHGEIIMPNRGEGFSSFGVKPPEEVLPN